jgi:hypothetical protein
MGIGFYKNSLPRKINLVQAFLQRQNPLFLNQRRGRVVQPNHRRIPLRQSNQFGPRLDGRAG